MERHIRRCQELHKKKLRDMKSSVDNKAPRAGSHLRAKAKKSALIEDRIKTIETENRILLQKMSHIMRSKGAVDNNNTFAQHGHSLNIDRRKRELARINKDNLKILQRIQEAKPAYNHRKWEQDARNNDKILHNICEFNPVIGGGGRGGTRRKGDGTDAGGRNLPLFKRELYELDFDESDSIYKYI